MFCPQCGQKLGEGARFCGSCGAAVAATSSVPPPTFPPKPAPDPRGAGSTSGGLPPGAVPPAGVDIARLVARVKAILLTPKTEWPVIAAEATQPKDIYFGYVAPLVAIGVVAGFIGSVLIGTSVPFVGAIRAGIVSALVTAILQFGLTFAGVFVIALIIDALAPSFGGTRNSLGALKVAAYSFTPGWVAGVLTIIPALGIIAGLIGLYGLYLLYLGLPVLMRNPEDKSIGYTAVVVLCAIVVWIVMGIVVASIGGIFGGSLIRISDAGQASREADSAAAIVSGILGGKSDADRARVKDAISTLSQLGADLERQQKAVQDAGKPGGPPANLDSALAAAGTLIAGGQKVEPVDFRKLKELLPDSIAGLRRTEASGQGGQAMGIKGSSARGRYEGDDGASLTLEIVDLGSLAGLASIAGKFDPSLERETSSGYERTRRVDGNLVHERYDRRSRSGQITALLGERFTIDVSGNRVDAKVLAEALRAVDAKQLLAAR